MMQTLCDIALKAHGLNMLDAINIIRGNTYQLSPEEIAKIHKEREKSGKQIAETEMPSSPNPTK